MKFEETILYNFSQLSSALKVLLEKRMNEIRLHGGQIFILFELWKEDGLSQIELARLLKVSAPTVNKMIKSLTESKFISTKSCRMDGRVQRIYLTDEGAAIRPEVEQQWEKVEEQLLANLTETEKLILQQLCEKLRDSLFSD